MVRSHLFGAVLACCVGLQTNTLDGDGLSGFYLNKYFKPARVINAKLITGCGFHISDAQVSPVLEIARKGGVSAVKFSSREWLTKQDIILRVEQAGRPILLVNRMGIYMSNHKTYQLGPEEFRKLSDVLDSMLPGQH